MSKTLNVVFVFIAIAIVVSLFITSLADIQPTQVTASSEANATQRAMDVTSGTTKNSFKPLVLVTILIVVLGMILSIFKMISRRISI